MSGKPAFSRSGFSNPFGSLTAEIPKIKLPEETKAILDREARKAGLNTSEFVRKLLMIRAHGKETVLTVEQEQINCIAGMGSDGGEDVTS